MASEIDYHSIIEHGFRPNDRGSRRVIIVGSGMAGLVAAHELQRVGHDPLILEAQARVGGRVMTLREPFSPGLYGEGGAMRIPTTHTLTLAYVDKFGLPLFPFTMNNPRAYYHIFGKKHRMADGDADPDRLGFPVAEHERGLPAEALWRAALQPITARLAVEGPSAWDSIARDYDGYCTREFLEACNWSEGAIEMFGLLLNQEAVMNSAFLELLREEVGDCYTNLVSIEGGMDQLPRAFLPSLQGKIRFGARMIAIDQGPESVTVHYRTAAGRMSATADYAIVTVPLPVLRHVEAIKPFSAGKQRAIRQVHYDAAAKVFLQSRRRFWEEDEGIFGGGTVTDLPIRATYYPDHGRQTGRGVLLASYTWSEDAQRWGSLPPADRITEALEDVAQIHPQITSEFEVGASKMWHDDDLAGGAYALFDPGQQSLLYQHMISPEGRIHFAGEHASLSHAWIQGAIESGLRAAQEIHEAT